MQLARAEVWEKIDRVRGDLPDDIGDIRSVQQLGFPRGGQPRSSRAGSRSKRDLSESYDLLERKIMRPLERCPASRRCVWTA